MFSTVVKTVEEGFILQVLIHVHVSNIHLVVWIRSLFLFVPQVDAYFFERLDGGERSYDGDYERCAHEKLEHGVLLKILANALLHGMRMPERTKFWRLFRLSKLLVELYRCFMQLLDIRKLEVILLVDFGKRHLGYEELDCFAQIQPPQLLDAAATLEECRLEARGCEEELDFGFLGEVLHEIQEVRVLVLVHVVDVVESDEEVLHGAKDVLDEVLLIVNLLALRVEAEPELIMLLLVDI